MADRTIQLEFVGGPFDGHTQSFSPPLSELGSTVALPVNDNVFRMLAGRRRGPACESRNVALYELYRRNGEWRYYFVSTRPAVELNLEAWRV